MTRTSDKGKARGNAPAESPDDVLVDLGDTEGDPTPAPVSTTSTPAPVVDDVSPRDEVDQDPPTEAVPLADGVDEDRATGRVGLYDNRLLRFVTTGDEVQGLYDNARALGADVDDVERYTVKRV